MDEMIIIDKDGKDKILIDKEGTIFTTMEDHECVFRNPNEDSVCIYCKLTYGDVIVMGKTPIILD
jgi:hypothetical protein